MRRRKLNQSSPNSSSTPFASSSSQNSSISSSSCSSCSSSSSSSCSSCSSSSSSSSSTIFSGVFHKLEPPADGYIVVAGPVPRIYHFERNALPPQAAPQEGTAVTFRAQGSRAVEVKSKPLATTNKTTDNRVQLTLDLAHAVAMPVDQLEPADCAEIRECATFLSAHQIFLRQTDSESLGLINKVHLDTIKKFREKQRDLQTAGLISNTKKGDSNHSTAVVSGFSSAMSFLETKLLDDLSVDMLLRTHRELAHGVCQGPGVIRRNYAKAGRTFFLPPDVLPAYLEDFVRSVKVVFNRKDLSPFTKAAWVASHFLVIHPFNDGNGRLARLLINWTLMKYGVPFSIVLCNNEANRSEFLQALRDYQEGKCHKLSVVISHAVLQAWKMTEKLRIDEEKKAVDIVHEQQVRKARETARSENCVICMEEKCNLTLLCCGGVFHFACISRWLLQSSNGNCPNCREVVPVPAGSNAAAAAAAAAAAIIPGLIIMEEDESTTTTGSDWETTSIGSQDMNTSVSLFLPASANYCRAQSCRNPRAITCPNDMCGTHCPGEGNFNCNRHNVTGRGMRPDDTDTTTTSTETDSDEWACRMCTLLNRGTRTCALCLTPRAF